MSKLSNTEKEENLKLTLGFLQQKMSFIYCFRVLELLEQDPTKCTASLTFSKLFAGQRERLHLQRDELDPQLRRHQKQIL